MSKIEEFKKFLESLPEKEMESVLNDINEIAQGKFERFKLSKELVNARDMMASLLRGDFSKLTRKNTKIGDHVFIVAKVTDITDFNKNDSYEDNKFFIQVAVPTISGISEEWVDPEVMGKL